jgi:hypothetical protein
LSRISTTNTLGILQSIFSIFIYHRLTLLTTETTFKPNLPVTNIAMGNSKSRLSSKPLGIPQEVLGAIEQVLGPGNPSIRYEYRDLDDNKRKLQWVLFQKSDLEDLIKETKDKHIDRFRWWSTGNTSYTIKNRG